MHHLYVLHVLRGSHHGVLRLTDARDNHGRLVFFIVKTLFLDYLPYQILCILGIVDGEVVTIADVLALNAQDACKDAVKRSHPKRPGVALVHQFLYALAHLVGCLVGEGERKDVPGLVTLPKQIGNLIGEHTRLATAGAGNHQRGSAAMLHGGTLTFVQFGEEIYFHI